VTAYYTSTSAVSLPPRLPPLLNLLLWEMLCCCFLLSCIRLSAWRRGKLWRAETCLACALGLCKFARLSRCHTKTPPPARVLT
jgi:hypothetical protein